MSWGGRKQGLKQDLPYPTWADGTREIVTNRLPAKELKRILHGIQYDTASSVGAAGYRLVEWRRVVQLYGSIEIEAGLLELSSERDFDSWVFQNFSILVEDRQNPYARELEILRVPFPT